LSGEEGGGHMMWRSENQYVTEIIKGRERNQKGWRLLVYWKYTSQGGTVHALLSFWLVVIQTELS
jgi:hypothetical protein